MLAHAPSVRWSFLLLDQFTWPALATAGVAAFGALALVAFSDRRNVHRQQTRQQLESGVDSKTPCDKSINDAERTNAVDESNSLNSDEKSPLLEANVSKKQQNPTLAESETRPGT